MFTKALNQRQANRAFSLIEMLVVIAILLMITAIGGQSWRQRTVNQELQSVADNLVARLELARTNSVTGKGDQNYGVKFNANSYVSFVGSSYIESNESNQTHQVDGRLEISTDIPGTAESVVFSKITGSTNYNHDLTITISELKDPDNKIEVVIGNLGEISVVK